MVGFVGSLLRGLMAIARGSRVDVGQGLRPGSGASALYLFLILVFLLIGGVLVLLGFDLDAVDAWLDGRQDWFRLVGDVAFKALLAAVLLACVAVAAAGVHGRLGALLRRGPPRGAKAGQADGFGWGAIMLAVIIGYFAAASLFA
jgi:hypothetical protein